MTKKQAVQILDEYIESFEGGASVWEALKMARKSLKNDSHKTAKEKTYTEADKEQQE